MPARNEMSAVTELAHSVAEVLDGSESAIALTVLVMIVAATLHDYRIPTDTFAARVDVLRASIANKGAS